MNKVGAPGTARRAGRPGAIGLLELAREARRCDDIAGAPDAGAAALAMGDQHRLAHARGDRRGGMAAWIMNEQPPTAVPSTHFGVRPR